jgi:hypothetical protein
MQVEVSLQWHEGHPRPSAVIVFREVLPLTDPPTFERVGELVAIEPDKVYTATIRTAAGQRVYQCDSHDINGNPCDPLDNPATSSCCRCVANCVDPPVPPPPPPPPNWDPTYELASAVNAETLGRLEGEAKAVHALLKAVNEVTLSRMEKDLDYIVAAIKED